MWPFLTDRYQGTTLSSAPLLSTISLQAPQRIPGAGTGGGDCGEGDQHPLGLSGLQALA